MQKQSQIPTPLHPAHLSRRAIEIVEPAPPSWWRILAILRFVFVGVLRSIAARLWPPWKRKYYTPLLNARRLRSFMEEMGGLWVKAGQIVALRRDLFEEEFCAELTRLQDRARGFPSSYSRRFIEEDLGRPLEEIFAEFEEAPLAAASIGQAHRARLRGESAEVVVKIRRPNIAANFARDLKYLHAFCWILSRFGIAPQFGWMDMYFEIGHAVEDELDYRQEAASLRRMHKQLRSQKIYVPKVFLAFCSDRVLVMEMIQGVYMSEYIQVAATDPERAAAWLKENDISARDAGERLLFSHYRQLFEDNFYHCDLHPGNILLQKNSRIALIDFGSVGSSDKSQLTKLLQLVISVGARDYRKVADVFLLLSPLIPDKDLSKMKEDVVRVFREMEPLTKIKTLPYHQKSLGRIVGEVVKVFGDAGVGISWEMLRSNRAELTLDASLMFLLPEIDYPKTIRRYVRKMRERHQKKMQKTEPIRLQLAKIAEQVDLPIKLAENAYFEGEYLRKRARKYEGYLSKASQVGIYMFLLLSRACVLAAGVAGVALLHQRFHILYRLRSTWVYSMFERLPRLDSLMWLLAMGGAIYLSAEIAAIQRVLEQPEPSKAGGDRR